MPQPRDGRLPPTYFCNECRHPFNSQIDLMKHEGSCAPRLRPQEPTVGAPPDAPFGPARREARDRQVRDDLVALLEELA